MEGHEKHVLYTEFELHEANSLVGGRGSAGGKLASLCGHAELPDLLFCCDLS